MNKLSFWDGIEQLGLTQNDIIAEYRAWFQWHNRADADRVFKLLKDERFVMLGKLRYYLDVIIGNTNRKEKIFIWEDFIKALDTTIEVYRGNAGIFNAQFSEKFPFVATTASLDLAKMFAEYSDAKALHLPIPPRNKTYWVVKVNVLLNNILGYRNLADQEVWISLEDYKKAEILIQCKE